MIDLRPQPIEIYPFPAAHRILIWNSIPTENHWQSVNKNTLGWLYGICFYYGSLAIADSGNNRVMTWDCRGIINYAKNTKD